MKWPKLVRIAKTPCSVVVQTEGISEDGEPIEITAKDLMCNYQSGGSKNYTNQKEGVELTGSAFFDGDIFPEIPLITSGSITIFGVERNIYKGSKCRNPDGTVNYTRLDIS